MNIDLSLSLTPCKTPFHARVKGESFTWELYGQGWSVPDEIQWWMASDGEAPLFPFSFFLSLSSSLSSDQEVLKGLNGDRRRWRSTVRRRQPPPSLPLSRGGGRPNEEEKPLCIPPYARLKASNGVANYNFAPLNPLASRAFL